MLSESDLSPFIGSEVLYKSAFGRLLFTEGVRYLAEHGGGAGAFWIIDAIGSYQPDKRITGNPRLRDFQLWSLTVRPDKTATLECREDSNLPALIVQQIEYTDFEFSIKLYVAVGEGGPVLMLPSEY